MSPALPAVTATATVDDLIWHWAAAAPDAVAVIDDTGQWTTYRELTAQANAVAAELAGLGVTTDQVVGVHYPRSVNGLVQLLGVWRTGGAALYLDPDWPLQRLQHMAVVCDVRVVRSPQPIPGLAPQPVPEAVSGGRLPQVHGPLCYVVFTSGSIGIPKGVLVEHPGVVNMATALAEIFTVGPGTRVLQFSAWSWDAAMGEILMTLTAGGTLVLAPPATRVGGPALAQLLRAHRVEVVTLTPSVLAAVPALDLPDLRTVAAVGEVCHPHLVDRWTAPHRRVFNGYGPTEATVAATVAACIPGADVHIGTPLPGVTAQVVDADGRPLPPGVIGELLIGGIGVARGYADSPAATATRFTTDSDGLRWYHTGDLVARRGDGTLTYVGRADDQVKLRGHRLTLGEVEHVLAAHPAVLGCAVVALADHLVAYLIADNEHLAEPAAAGLVAAVRNHARALLPPFAVPDLVRVVAALPLTASGKVDRDVVLRWAAETSADPAPGSDDTTAQASLPRVLEVVAAVLDRPMRPDTDIIDTGGHSLLVAQLCVALSEALGVEVPYVTVALNRTPAGIAAAIDQLTGTPNRIDTPGGAPSAAV
ncbi:non-ribosomal peptide synthetase [Dactylosporangium darangshiense]|uniref:Carrier domain-containing protein n=1 Tax=Dactylosporangium darangshiense TaxID=579108 RepID=A0ABP8DCH7_9ACTN